MKRILFCLFVLFFIGVISYTGYQNGQIEKDEILVSCLIHLLFLFWACFIIARNVILTDEGIDIRFGKQIKKSIPYKEITKIEILMCPTRVEIYGKDGVFYKIRFKQLSYLYMWLADLFLKDYSLHKRIRNFSFDDSIGTRVKEEMKKRKESNV